MLGGRVSGLSHHSANIGSGGVYQQTSLRIIGDLTGEPSLQFSD
jgi:hypothetical protein